MPDSLSSISPEHPDPEMIGYRPVSGWALAALGLGLASPLAFAHVVLWIVPLLAIFAAVVALVRLRRTAIPMLGRKAALLGLMVALVCGVAAPARLETRSLWLAARARRVADRWFDALRAGKSWEAFGLQLHSEEKSKPKMHGVAAPDDLAESKSDLQKYAEKTPVAALLSLGDAARPELVGSNVGSDDFGHDMVVLVYKINADSSASGTGKSTPAPSKDATGSASPRKSPADPLHVQLVIQRRIDFDSRERWLIYTVQ